MLSLSLSLSPSLSLAIYIYIYIPLYVSVQKLHVPFKKAENKLKNEYVIGNLFFFILSN